jgi:hypothetical protein
MLSTIYPLGYHLTHYASTNNHCIDFSNGAKRIHIGVHHLSISRPCIHTGQSFVFHHALFGSTYGRVQNPYLIHDFSMT